jgi:hypothetical protein
VKRVLIIGGGISGLIASHVFRACRDVDVRVMEPGKPGGEFTAGGLKYIHRTDSMTAMLGDLGMVYSNYGIRGGILLKGKVEPYPKCLQAMPKEQSRRIQYDHYRKTRRQEPGEFSNRAMNDPEAVGERRAIRCDYELLIDTLAREATFIKARLAKVCDNFVLTDRGNKHDFDFLVLTIPLFVIKRLVDFEVPDGHAMRLNLINVEVQRDAYAKWDYVYTPYTPANAIHRVSTMDGGYSCEVTGELDMKSAEDDLGFLFKSGYYTMDVREGLKGHLLPLMYRPEWPANVAPLGRFAKWDPRSTADVVLDDAIAMARHWGWTTTA